MERGPATMIVTQSHTALATVTHHVFKMVEQSTIVHGTFNSGSDIALVRTIVSYIFFFSCSNGDGACSNNSNSVGANSW